MSQLSGCLDDGLIWYLIIEKNVSKPHHSITSGLLRKSARTAEDLVIRVCQAIAREKMLQITSAWLKGLPKELCAVGLPHGSLSIFGLLEFHVAEDLGLRPGKEAGLSEARNSKQRRFAIVPTSTHRDSITRRVALCSPGGSSGPKADKRP